MAASVHGLHHVTAIAGDAGQNLDFYTRVLGLRLVKKSVNQDAPDTYHLFFADGEGTPGTDLTFFPWPTMRPARRGTGMAEDVAFAVPHGSLAYWRRRLRQHDVAVREEKQFAETRLSFSDPHGLGLALVEIENDRAFAPWEKSSVPVDLQLRGMHAVRLAVREREATHLVLTTILGFAHLAEDAGTHRYGVGGGSSGTLLDLEERKDGEPGRWGTGGIHHVAWRVSDTDEQAALRRRLSQVGLAPSPPIDRFWFHSVYFREPGGVLFELATDGPGFTRDEALDHLGETLILPPWLEARREEIEAALPSLDAPAVEG